jgi:predicted MPP superfamily phosphohydrolase
MSLPDFLDSDEIKRRLDARLGPVHARQRLGIEREHEAQAFGQGLTLFHMENLPYSHVVIESVLRLTGMFWIGRRNASMIRVVTREVVSDRLPAAFDGYAILQLTDLHCDMNPRAMARLMRAIEGLDYDLCVLTGDYRGQTFGDYRPCLKGLARIREEIKTDVYAVLGNHDTILMTPDLEDMGIRVLLNEHVVIERDGARIWLAGVDDAHFFRVDNIEKAAENIPEDGYSILLSHTPEIYRQASHAGFDLMLCGHTHGGQICLPGGVPVILDAVIPRYMGRGAWKFGAMEGYTSPGAGSSIVPVRFNCPPEITVHRLRRRPSAGQ